MNKLIVFTYIGILLLSCQTGASKQDVQDSVSTSKDTVSVPADAPARHKIITQVVSQQLYSSEFSTTGTVQAPAGQLAEIGVPLDGRVTKSVVKLGQHVNAGSPIMELSSTEFYEAEKNYFQSLQNKNKQERQVQRQRDLVKNGVGIQRELEEAEADYANALREYEQSMAGLRIFNVDPSKLVMGQALIVVSPIAGEVVQNNIVLGQYVKNDAAPLVIVANLNTVWVVAQVKERYIGVIKPNDQVEIRTDAAPANTIKGTVYHINELLDMDTRSVQVLVACDNKQRNLKPGMFTGVRFIGMPQQSILIPSTALLQNGDSSFVFVQLSKDTYVKRPVEASTASNGLSLITKGLEVGETIVADGGIYLIN